MLDTRHVESELQSAKDFAASRGLADQLQRKLNHLDTYANGEGGLYYAGPDKSGTRCTFAKDKSPYSFGFVMDRLVDGQYVYWFTGALLY